MLDLMSVNHKHGSTPLYIYTISCILCKIKIVQQEAGTRFGYTGFKDRIDKAGLTPSQRLPLDKRLGTLESFMFRSQTTLPTQGTKGLKQKGKVRTKGTGWNAKVSSHPQTSLTNLNITVGTPYDRGSLLSMCHARDGMLPVQYLLKHFS